MLASERLLVASTATPPLQAAQLLACGSCLDCADRFIKFTRCQYSSVRWANESVLAAIFLLYYVRKTCNISLNFSLLHARACKLFSALLIGNVQITLWVKKCDATNSTLKDYTAGTSSRLFHMLSLRNKRVTRYYNPERALGGNTYIKIGDLNPRTIQVQERIQKWILAHQSNTLLVSQKERKPPVVINEGRVPEQAWLSRHWAAL